MTTSTVGVTAQELRDMGFLCVGGGTYVRGMGVYGQLLIAPDDLSICLVSNQGEGLDFPTKMLDANKINSFINTYTS